MSHALKFRLLFALLMSGWMCLLMTGWIGWLRSGWGEGFALHWLHSFVQAWPMAFAVVLGSGPRVQNLAQRLLAWCGPALQPQPEPQANATPSP